MPAHTQHWNEYRIDHHADGKIMIDRHTPDDSPVIYRAIGIKNLTEVMSHTICEIAGSRSHLVQFVNGGELQFAYTLQGQLLTVAAKRVRVTISDEHEITFGALAPRGAA